MTYLELCQEFVSEIGVAGGTGPTTVTGQTGILGNVCRWIRQAENDINTEWTNWKYLWTEYNEMLQAGVSVPPVPSTPSGVKVRQWNRSSLFLNKATNNPSQLQYVPWEVFRARYAVGAPVAGRPAIWSIKPDNTLVFDRPSDAIYSLSAEFWRRPILMRLDNDMPLMPEEYHRLIVTTAAVKYANKEDAPEIISGMESEMIAMMAHLKANQLEGFEFDTMSTQDVSLAMMLPGEAD